MTGVQTCALPISRLMADGNLSEADLARDLGAGLLMVGHAIAMHERRSEERRVGKECRSRWSPEH